MSEKSIRRLKNKFILTAMVSFFLVMLFIAGCIYAMNAVATRRIIKENLQYIVDCDGVLPVQYESLDADDTGNSGESIKSKSEFIKRLEKLFGVETEYISDEFYYSTRYFAVLYDENDELESVITSHTAAVEADQAVTYANTVRDRFFNFGSYDDYYYLVADRDEGGTIVVVMDCSNQINTSRRLVTLALILIAFGMFVSAFIIRTWSGKIVQKEVKNAELQNAFITNASHELKTPLAVIKANTEMIEMMGQENEWTQSTMRQVDRLTGLIQNLVMVTRANELDSQVDRVEIDFSGIARDTIQSYETVATQDGKTMESHISDGVVLLAHEGDVRQIVTLLIDNAIKYCDDNGTVSVTLNKSKKKNVVLRVSNNYAAGEGLDYSKFFDRFYRGEESHNIDKGGYGVGLSIAQGLMERYHGSIDVTWNEGVITFTCVF